MHKFAIKEMQQLQYACVKMEEIGAVSEGIGLSSKLKLIIIYHSVRKPGYVYELTLYRGDYYQCTHCRRLGKKDLL